jgi:hypothetical protein
MESPRRPEELDVNAIAYFMLDGIDEAGLKPILGVLVWLKAGGSAA